MKVGILNNPITVINPQRIGGVERVALYELEYLHKKGIQAKFYVRGYKGKHLHIQVIENFNYNRDVGRIYYSWFVKENIHSDILHGMNTPMLSLVSDKTSHTLIHLHNSTILPYYDLAKEKYQKSYFAFCSKFLNNDFLQKNPQISSKKCFTIYNGVDTLKFTPSKRKVKPDKPKIFFTGAWNEAKGIFILLRAIKLLEKKRKDFQFVLGGSPYIYDTGTPQGWQLKAEEKVQSLAHRLKSVKVLGLINYENLPQTFQSTDIFVNPAVWQEPFGLVNIEAMSTGLPIISTQVGGIPEIVVNGKTGFLVPPNDTHALVEAIETLLDDDQLRITMGREGRRRVERSFTWKNHIEKLIKLYKLILRAR